MKRALAITLIFIISFPSFAKKKRPVKRTTITFEVFKSDGCSAYPDGIPFIETSAWLHCCMAHDIEYYVGGTFEEKALADEELNSCVAGNSADWHGSVMEWGVYLGGTPYMNTGWRWGYGWNLLRPYGDRSEFEDRMISKKYDSILEGISEWTEYLSPNQLEYVIKKYRTKREEIFKYIVLPISESSRKNYERELLIDSLFESVSKN